MSDDVKRWVADHWDPELSIREWRTLLADSPWAFATAEIAAVGVPGPPDGVGVWLVIPVLREHGSEDLQNRFSRPTLTGAITWCQLFSEPGAGSDLAGLSTRAVRDGADWLVTGQKVWSTGAKTADYGLLLARTDADVPKHRGITAFVLPMRQLAVDVRPLRQMNGHSSFNEVFFDGASVPGANVIGELGGGWTVALTTLAHERRLAASKPAAAPPGAIGRAWREAMQERTAAAEPHKWYPQRAGRPDLVVPQARDNSKDTDPVTRQAIARLTATTQVARWTAERFRAAAGQNPGPVGSIGKLASSDIARQAARVHGSIAGAAGMLAGAGAPLDGTIAEILVSLPGISIAGR